MRRLLRVWNFSFYNPSYIYDWSTGFTTDPVFNYVDFLAVAVTTSA